MKRKNKEQKKNNRKAEKNKVKWLRIILMLSIILIVLFGILIFVYFLNLSISKQGPIALPEELIQEYQERIGQYEEKLKTATSDQERQKTMLAIGAAKFALGDYRGSQIAYENLLDQFPENSQGFLGLGDCFLEFKKYTKAENAYLKALERDPGSIDVYRKLFYLYTSILKKNKSQILAFLEKGQKALGENNKSILELYYAYAQKTNDLTAQKKWLEKILAVDPNDDEYQKELKILVETP